MDFIDFDFNKVSHCNCVEPSYEHSNNILKITPDFYGVAYRQKNNMISAFCIFSKKDGHIVQLGYTDTVELKLIIQQLIIKFDNVVIKNIDIIYSEVLTLLHYMGFKEICKQFEMVKSIKDFK
ncbi:MAG: hypothetical protein E6929_14960 [Clostridium sp.]|nr:hypothetical protein [Clostridium sp.]